MTRTILITGCSSGIGLDAARTLRARGWRVFASCRAESDCNRLRDEGFEAPRIDYEDRDSIAEGARDVLAATSGRLDALFNNGAYAIPGPLEDVPAEAMETIFHANFLGWHDLTCRLIPTMRAQGHGRIVNNSSVLGIVGAPWRGAYVASKFALEGWSDVLRQEMRPAGIDVVLIEPGPITTEFRANAVRQFERWIDWQGSARAQEYRDGLLDNLYRGNTGASWPASAVTARLIEALEARRPRPRYFVTPHTHAAGLLRRLLPSRTLDRVLGRG